MRWLRKMVPFIGIVLIAGCHLVLTSIDAVEETSGDEALTGDVIAIGVADTVLILRFFRFASDVERFRS